MAKKRINQRDIEHDIDPIFPTRWSPRAMSGEKIEKEELLELLEAARWAPSSYNEQPWRFVYALRDTKEWDTFFGFIFDGNKVWCGNAAALVVMISKRNFEMNGKVNNNHSFDTGAAWENLALQGSMKGLVVHCMAGFDHESAKELLEIPDEYDIEAMAAIGKHGELEVLPQKLREMEVPSSRKKVEEISFEGKYINNRIPQYKKT